MNLFLVCKCLWFWPTHNASVRCQSDSKQKSCGVSSWSCWASHPPGSLFRPRPSVSVRQGTKRLPALKACRVMVSIKWHLCEKFKCKTLHAIIIIHHYWLMLVYRNSSLHSVNYLSKGFWEMYWNNWFNPVWMKHTLKHRWWHTIALNSPHFCLLRD